MRAFDRLPATAGVARKRAILTRSLARKDSLRQRQPLFGAVSITIQRANSSAIGAAKRGAMIQPTPAKAKPAKPFETRG